jgi:hypothetical protein
MPAFFSRCRRFVLLLIGIALTFALSGELSAQQQIENKTFVVIGSGTVRSGNVQAARQMAIKDSLVTAVELMTAEVLQKDALINNFPRISEILYSHPDKYIKNYKVLTEATSGDHHRVVVEAIVSGNQIVKLFSQEGVLRAKPSLPSILFLISEQNLNEIIPQYWWGTGMGNFQPLSEKAMIPIFKQKGIDVVDHRGVRLQNIVDWVADARPDLTDAQAAELGAHLKADIVVVGHSGATESTNTMGTEMKSFKADFRARALRTETGEEILALAETAVATNTDEYEGGREALSNVGAVAGGQLVEQLTAAWRKIVEKPSQLELIVEGTNKLANFVKFRKALSSISGVEGIKVKEIKPNETTLLVDYHGKGKDLAAALMRKTFDTFGIDIHEISQNILKITLVPA